MDIQRSKPPETVQRDISIHLTKDETLAILSDYLAKKLGTNTIKVNNIEVTASTDGKLNTMVLSGTETLTISWPTTVTSPAIPAIPK